MDKVNPSVRKYIAQRADLIGAIRLPDNTFQRAAGTRVTSDIIFLKKRERITNIEPDWVNLDKNQDGITINKYFVENPNMILGNMTTETGPHGLVSNCKADETKTLEEQLNEAIQNISTQITDYEIEDVEDNVEMIPADPNVRNFSYTIVDGKIYYRENSNMILKDDLPLTTENRIKELIKVRDVVRELIDYQVNDYSNEEIQAKQRELNQVYDNFTKRYGLINSRGNKNAFSEDSSYYLLTSLENLDDQGNLKSKADMFSKRTIAPHKAVTSVDTANEALIVSLSEKAKVDIPFMQSLCNMDKDKMIEELKGEIFNVPEYGESNNWVTADEYLSGNIREKLKIAEEFAKNDERFKINVEYLQKVMPKDLTPAEISIRLGATWIPEKYIEDFIFELLHTPNYLWKWGNKEIKVHYSEYDGEWNIEGKSRDRSNVYVYNTYGTSRINAYKIIEETLNLRDVRIFDTCIDAKGNKQRILNKKETAIAQGKQEQIKEAFQEWVWKDIDRRDDLTRIYNERFNSTRPREYDGSHINFVGMNPEINLRTHQRNADAHILYGGNTLLAHGVGAGKTFVMVAAAMESKRLGLCNKSLFVVPNHIIDQIASDFMQLYPTANILVATKKDFSTNNRKRFCSKIATRRI